jgi:hypothetical protein
MVKIKIKDVIILAFSHLLIYTIKFPTQGT